MLNALRESGFGVAFKCCISGNSFRMVGYFFVEDYTLIPVAPSPDTLTDDTVKLAQHGLDLFVGVIRATGGQVNEDKSKWCLLEFQWYLTGKCRMAENNGTLTIVNPHGRKTLERLPVTQASQILGVWIATNGSSNEQVRQIRSMTAAWADRVRIGHILWDKAWNYYQTTLKRSIEYPLVATTMEEPQ